ncbi:MAG TPA: hypothetical protein VFS43_23725, partial [Polyangiaceae bacterium]|nr:hypothetical protein [Polyangiaceae bacterium]
MTAPPSRPRAGGGGRRSLPSAGAAGKALALAATLAFVTVVGLRAGPAASRAAAAAPASAPAEASAPAPPATLAPAPPPAAAAPATSGGAPG